MANKAFVMVLIAAILAASTAAADLQNVAIGGQIRIRGNWWQNSFNRGNSPSLVRYEIRWPAAAMYGRPIGSFLGGQTIVSHFDWDNHGPDYKNIEQRTTLNLYADFTDNVSAFIELDSFDIWGEDFRSNYLTGIDSRADTRNDVEIYQSYVQAADMFGVPLRLRVGRQELILGRGWLVGNNSHLPEFTGLSFDGVRATYTNGSFSIDAFWTKLFESLASEEDGDIDFGGVYATCNAVEDVQFEAYWLWLRDAGAVKDTNLPWLRERLEDLIGLDNYDVTNLHTLGLRASGEIADFDFNVEAAYQLGNASRAGALFAPFDYGDDRADFNAWAADAEVGYRFDCAWDPRIYIGGAYFCGEDNRDISFWQWLNPLAPFMRPQASISFNRLFSDTPYSDIFDEMGELSNFWTARGGFSVEPTESLKLGAEVAYFRAVDTFDAPVHFWLSRYRISFASQASFWTQNTDSELGWQTHLWFKYHYTEDLFITAGWEHLFTGEALKEGNFVDLNGLLYNGGTDNDAADYLYIQTTLRF